MGFDPLRTRLVFLHLLPPRARAAFRDAVLEALAGIQPPPPRDDPRLETLHMIWIEARREALERYLQAEKEAGRPQRRIRPQR
jgi:hypothetical protein